MRGAPYFDSLDPGCKTPFGAVKTGQEVSFTLHIPKNLPAGECRMIFIPADEGEPVPVPMQLSAVDCKNNAYRCTVAEEQPCVWFYHFEIQTGDEIQTVMRGHDRRSFIGRGDSWQLTVYDKGMEAPACLREGVMYQIFPDRFYNSERPKWGVPADRVLRQDWHGLPEWRPTPAGKVLNNDYFGGDLQGIMQKLDYLSGLGVTCIYLNPIFEAHSNHRYNTADYTRIDPVLGSEEDFVALCAAAKEKGVSIILDGVFSHTGSDSIYFNKEGRYGAGGAYNDQDSPYYDWYKFDDWPDDYESWWGFVTLPNVEETVPSYIEFIAGKNGVAKKWLDLGAGGFRLDVADELPDVFLDALYAQVKAHSPDAAVIGEVWEDASNKVSYGLRRRYLLGKQMDSVMNYPFKNALLHYMRYGGGESFLGSIMRIIENYPPPVLSVLMNSLSTHDTERAITALGGEPSGHHDRAWQRDRQHLPEAQYWHGRSLFALGAIIQYGLPGLPCLYYGDEAGMCGYKDPFNRACYPWGKEDAGLVDFFRTLGKVRAGFPIFSEAQFLPLIFTDELCVFSREKDDIEIMFAVNRSGAPQALPLPDKFATARVLAVFGELREGILAPLSGVILSAG